MNGRKRLQSMEVRRVHKVQCAVNCERKKHVITKNLKHLSKRDDSDHRIVVFDDPNVVNAMRDGLNHHGHQRTASGNSSSDEDDELKDELIQNSSNIPSRFLSFNRAFTALTMSSGGPPQSMYAMRSPAESVAIAAATVSSQQARVNGEISPIRTPSSSTMATDQNSERSFESGRGRRKILFPAKITNHIHHADFPNAQAIIIAIEAAVPGFGVIAVPHAYGDAFRGSENRQGVADGGGDGEGPQRRLAQAELGNFMSQQQICHAKQLSANID
nr:hypothetical protein Iba_scaffold150CG0580 [Ipomoea batatas]GME20894.1 hypothetical protein Iba_scaffold26362CG0030 [Ipomoea batatas]